jgi:hypothetical protein
MKCILCLYDEELWPPPDGVERDAVFTVNGMSTCREHLGEALCGDIDHALRSLTTQTRMKRERTR